MKKIKFNIIDAVIIAAVIAALAIFGYFAMGSWELSEGETEKVMCYTVELSNVTEEYLNRVNVGDEVFDVIKGAAIGKVAEVGEIKPFERISNDEENGIYVKTPVPERYTYTVKIRTPYEESDKGYTINDMEIKVGKKITFKTKNLASDAVILKLEKEAAQ